MASVIASYLRGGHLRKRQTQSQVSGSSGQIHSVAKLFAAVCAWGAQNEARTSTDLWRKVAVGFTEHVGGIEWLSIMVFIVLPAIWVWRDSKPGTVVGGRLWVLLVLLTGWLGLIVYLLVRQNYRKYIDR